MSAHFVNLSNGLKCGHQPDRPHYLRIQSTWCEQKRWNDILITASADLLYHLATGEHVIVHDKSEKDRVTRALWQGMAWIVYACERSWGLPARKPIMRNGHNATGYFHGVFDGLPEKTVNYLRYFRQYNDGTTTPDWTPCSVQLAGVSAKPIPDYPPDEWRELVFEPRPLPKKRKLERKVIPLTEKMEPVPA